MGYENPSDCKSYYRDVSVPCKLGFELSHPVKLGNERKLRLRYFSRISPFSFFFLLVLENSFYHEFSSF